VAHSGAATWHPMVGCFGRRVVVTWPWFREFWRVVDPFKGRGSIRAGFRFNQLMERGEVVITAVGTCNTIDPGAVPIRRVVIPTARQRSMQTHMTGVTTKTRSGKQNC
jgi:hypothetical protein